MADLLLKQHMVPVDSLERYIHWVNQIPALSEAEELGLADEYKQTNSVSAAKKMVLAHLRYVVHVARGYTGYGLALSDLIQEGNLGLMEAVRRYDPSKGARLATFSMYWIKCKIHDFIVKNIRIVKAITTKPMLKLFFKLRSSMANSCKQFLTQDEVEMIAKMQNVSVKDVREGEIRVLASDYSYVGDEVETSDFGVIGHLPADHQYQPELLAEKKQLEAVTMEALKGALSQLDDRSRDIVSKRWLTPKKEKLKVLAELHSVSVERIRQLEKHAISKLSSLVKGILPDDLCAVLAKGDSDNDSRN